jgi:hypothetical protein
MISLSQMPLLTHDNTIQYDEDKHPCFKRDSNPRPQRPSDHGLCLRTRGNRGQSERTIIRTLIPSTDAGRFESPNPVIAHAKMPAIFSKYVIILPEAMDFLVREIFFSFRK